MIGGLAKIYQSVSDLYDDYIQSNQNKDVLLKPKSKLPFYSPEASLLLTEAFSSPSLAPKSATGLYTCPSACGLRSTYARACPDCRKSFMSNIDNSYVLASEADAKGGGFVKGQHCFALLNKFNVKDLGALEEKVVHISMNEVISFRSFVHLSKYIVHIML
ncbi:hypothetical protein HanPI659440_Chr13g0497461 [Helianthus annuus]|nr:hypothetical protein HanPI659440_Chr13g0497461 [Helianthus annuus]